MAFNARKRKKGRKRFRRAKRSHLGLWTCVLLLLILAGYLVLLEVERPHPTGDRLRLNELTTAVEDDRVSSAQVLDEDALITGVYKRTDGTVAKYNAPLLRGTQSGILTFLLDNDVPTDIKQQPGKRVAAVAQFAMPVMMLVVIFGYFILASRRGTGLFATGHGGRQHTKDEVKLTFADVAGADSAIAELAEIKAFLKEPERFEELGADVPKGVLIFGPPGCGKTLLARALAGEAGASFFAISGSDFVELYVGVGASRVRNLFREARENAPALIFIDELDSVGRARIGPDGGATHAEQEQALNQILTEMDGFSPSEGIIVLAATNRADVLDPAILRPGRFDRTIALPLPNEEGRAAILRLHAAKRKLGPDVDLDVIAREAIGLSGADLAGIVNEGALLAVRAQRTAVTQEDLMTALHRILQAPEAQRRLSQRAKSVATRFAKTERITFDDVAGQDEAVTELREIRDFLVHPERFQAVGVIAPKGVLLHGPPGVGKTLLARALACEANAAFFSVGASQFVGQFAGQGAARVRDMFSEARSMPPAIIFIDEVDSIGRSRGGSGVRQSHGPEQEQALNQLLAEMDGFATGEGLLVLAATNRADTLDPALLRPGRFDRSVGLALPSEAGRLAILQIHQEGKRLDERADLAEIARKAIGLTGADLANVINEAGILAVRDGRERILHDDLETSLQRTLSAPAEQRRLALRGRSIGRRAAPTSRVTFADLAGVDDAVEELTEVVSFLAEPERFKALGARPPRGILLSGPPGCGKTMLARAVAGEANAAFFSAAGSEFVEVFVGEGASRVRDLFGEAKSMAPSILFIDEIDAIGGARSTGSFGNREIDQTLNQILIELDGFESDSAMIIMAATNRPDLLDAALVRPGRIDRRVTVSLPDRAGRLAILELRAKQVPVGPDVDLSAIAGLTRGFSGADLSNLLNEAALLAGRRGAATLSMALVEEGIDRAVIGLTSRAIVLSDDERRVVAHHEAGHALVALCVPGASPPHKLTVVPRGGSLGHCSMMDDRDHVLLSRKMLMGRMATLLGGMVAEELCFGEPTSGPSSDLAMVGEVARQMVREFGMGPSVGPLAYPDPYSRDGRPKRGYSEDSARMIDAEVRQLVDTARRQAVDVLTRHRRALERVAAALIEHETLTAVEFEKIAGVGPDAA